MKRKVNINRPEISSEKISKRKNFDSVLKNSTNISSKPFLKKPWFLSSVIVATMALVGAIAFLNKDVEKKNQVSGIKNQEQVTTNELEFYKKEEAKPCINPPLKGLNVPYTTYKVIAEKGANLDFKTGSKLIVPKDAFVDRNGKSLKGEVELRYREFHDPIDFFVSGIPMTYDSAGVKYQFESAGMMEMLAFQDGKKVNMAPAKSISVQLASNYKGTEYNLYKLDTVKNNWSCLGKDKVVANQIFSATKDSIKTPISVQQTPEYKTIETRKQETQKEKEIKIADLPKPSPEPKKPNKSRKDKYTFNIEVDEKDFPELTIYQGAIFEVGVENKNFTKEMYDITWDDVRISQGSKKGENYLLTLKKSSKKLELYVYPVYEGKNYESALKAFQDKFSKYNLALEKRKLEEKRIEEEYQSKLLALQNQQKELEQKWKQDQANQFKQMGSEEKVQRLFAISSFGIYNCDNPSVYPNGINCNANLTNDNNVKLLCYNIYLVDKSKNGLFTYYKNPITNFSFNPGSTNMLWTVEDGVLYWLKPEKFIDIRGNGGLNEIKLNRVDQKFVNIEELKAYFNL